jgi:NCAIR mutase (PurE)-related protein
VKVEDLKALLARVQAAELTIEAALVELAEMPVRDLGFARLDTHRELRTGAPEVVFGGGKTPEQLAAIVAALAERGGNVLATRVSEEAAAVVSAAVPAAKWDKLSKVLLVEQAPVVENGRGTVLVVCAGTSDLPVAEEAALTAQLFGSRVERIADVGVAGIHRVIAERPRLEAAEVVVVVAGMEGALPSVVKGLCSRPVIAVPTSVGYGASFGGLAALLGMLNACAAGITVVNIDNGYGAGFAAALMNANRKHA